MPKVTQLMSGVSGIWFWAVLLQIWRKNVKIFQLLSLNRKNLELAWISSCCGCGVGLWLQCWFDPSSLGTSICHECGPKKPKKKKKTKKTKKPKQKKPLTMISQPLKVALFCFLVYIQLYEKAYVNCCPSTGLFSKTMCSDNCDVFCQLRFLLFRPLLPRVNVILQVQNHVKGKHWKVEETETLKWKINEQKMITKINLTINAVHLPRTYQVLHMSLGPGNTLVNAIDKVPSLIVFSFFFFFWPNYRYEVPRPGIRSEPQLWPRLQLQQCQILDPLHWAGIKPESWHCRDATVLVPQWSCCTTVGTPLRI